MLPKSANVVIIGGGVLGTSAAFHLAEAGHQDILLLDRGPIASGTTPFAAGQTGYLNKDGFSEPFTTYCIEFFENFAARTGQSIDFQRCGSLRVALTEKYQADLEKRVQARDDLSSDVEFISPARAKELVPGFHPPEGCRIASIPHDGYVEPKSVAVAFAAAAKERGVKFHTRVEVTSLCTSGDRVSGIQTNQGAIETRNVVLAAGAWTRQICQSVGVNVRSVPVRHQAFVTAPISGVLPAQPIVRVTEPQIYVRHEAGGLLVGGYGYRPLSFDMDDFPSGFEISALEADPIYYEQLRTAATLFFPAIKDAIIVQERRGLPTISPDGQLIISEPNGVGGLILATACGVGGIARSPGVGRVVSDILSGQSPLVPLAQLDARRFDETYSSDIQLRSRCEELYARHYHELV